MRRGDEGLAYPRVVFSRVLTSSLASHGVWADRGGDGGGLTPCVDLICLVQKAPPPTHTHTLFGG